LQFSNPRDIYRIVSRLDLDYETRPVKTEGAVAGYNAHPPAPLFFARRKRVESGT